MNTRGRSKSGEDEDEYGSLMSNFEYGAESLREGVKAISRRRGPGENHEEKMGFREGNAAIYSVIERERSDGGGHEADDESRACTSGRCDLADTQSILSWPSFVEPHFDLDFSATCSQCSAESVSTFTYLWRFRRRRCVCNARSSI